MPLPETMLSIQERLIALQSDDREMLDQSEPALRVCWTAQCAARTRNANDSKGFSAAGAAAGEARLPAALSR